MEREGKNVPSREGVRAMSGSCCESCGKFVMGMAVGAVAGAIVGAMVGETEIPEFYLEGLEPTEILRTLAVDMFQGCPMERTSNFFDCEWEEKYIAPGN